MSEIVVGINAAINFINVAKSSSVLELSSVHEEATSVIARFRVLDVVEWERLLLYLLEKKDTSVRGTLCIGTDYLLRDGKLFYAWTFTLLNQVSVDDAVKDFVNLVTSYVTKSTPIAAPPVEAPVAVDTRVTEAVTAIKTLLSKQTLPVPRPASDKTDAAPPPAPKQKQASVNPEVVVSRIEMETPSGGLAIPVDLGKRGVFKQSERLTASKNPTLPRVQYD